MGDRRYLRRRVDVFIIPIGVGKELFTGKPMALLTVAVKVFDAQYTDFSMLSSALIGALEALGEKTPLFPESVPTVSPQG